MNDTMVISLTKGKLAVVDVSDSYIVLPFNWCAVYKGKNWYAYMTDRNPPYMTVYMHSLITGFTLTDHKDGNGLNNSRSNLRLATHAQNCQNSRKREGSSRFKGVNWDSQRRRWYSCICIDGKTISLGRHILEEDAARAYDNAALQYFGEYARINFPIEDFTLGSM